MAQHPFPDLKAEYDLNRLNYYTRFEQIRSLNRAGIAGWRKPWIFFGNEGCGKTALRKLVASWGKPDSLEGNIICLEFSETDFRQIFSGSNETVTFSANFLSLVYQKVADLFGSIGGLSQIGIHRKSPQIHWLIFHEFVDATGLKRIICLIDPYLDQFEAGKLRIQIEDSIKELLELPATPENWFLLLDVTEFPRSITSDASSFQKIIVSRKKHTLEF